MGEVARRELKELLDRAAVRIREAEAGAEAALRDRYDTEAHRACLEEKCRILLGLPEAATHLESCTPPLAAALQNWLAGYSSDSVFISGAGNAELGARFMPTGSSSGWSTSSR